MEYFGSYGFRKVQIRGLLENTRIATPPLVLQIEGRVGSHFEGILVPHKTVVGDFPFSEYLPKFGYSCISRDFGNKMDHFERENVNPRVVGHENLEN